MLAVGRHRLASAPRAPCRLCRDRLLRPCVLDVSCASNHAVARAFLDRSSFLDGRSRSKICRGRSPLERRECAVAPVASRNGPAVRAFSRSPAGASWRLSSLRTFPDRGVLSCPTRDGRQEIRGRFALFRFVPSRFRLRLRLRLRLVLFRFVSGAPRRDVGVLHQCHRGGDDIPWLAAGERQPGRSGGSARPLRRPRVPQVPHEGDGLARAPLLLQLCPYELHHAHAGSGTLGRPEGWSSR